MRPDWAGFNGQASAGESHNERFLLSGLDSFDAVVGTDPGDGLARRMAAQDGEAGQGSSGPPVTTEAADLHPFPGTSPGQHGSQSRDDLSRIVGDTEVWPVEVIVRPRRLPPIVQIEPVIRRLVPGVGVRGIERHGGDFGAVRQDDD
jgi:hypothetical protein